LSVAANATTTNGFSTSISSPVPARLRQRPSRSSPPAKEDTPPVAPAPLKAENDTTRPTVSAEEIDRRLLASFAQHCPYSADRWIDSDRRAAANFLAANWTKVCADEGAAYDFAEWLGEGWPHWHSQRVMPDFPTTAWLNGDGKSFADEFLQSFGGRQ